MSFNFFEVFQIVVWSLESGVNAYLRTVIAELLRNSKRDSALFW